MKNVEISFSQPSGTIDVFIILVDPKYNTRYELIDAIKNKFSYLFPKRDLMLFKYYCDNKELSHQIDVNKINELKVVTHHCVPTVTIIGTNGEKYYVTDFCYDIETKTSAQLIERFKKYCCDSLDFSEFYFYSNDVKLPFCIQDLTFDHLVLKKK